MYGVLIRGNLFLWSFVTCCNLLVFFWGFYEKVSSTVYYINNVQIPPPIHQLQLPIQSNAALTLSLTYLRDKVPYIDSVWRNSNSPECPTLFRPGATTHMSLWLTKGPYCSTHPFRWFGSQSTYIVIHNPSRVTALCSRAWGSASHPLSKAELGGRTTHPLLRIRSWVPSSQPL